MGLLGAGLPKLSTKKLLSIQIDRFNGGSNVLLSETRLKENEAKEATNLMLVEDGIWKKRWGSESYGATFTNRPDGFFEYRTTAGARELITVADGKVYKNDPSDDSKIEITGATFTQGYPAYFLQINDLLYIGNSYDDLAVYNGTSLSTYTGLDTPENVSVSRTGLSTGSYTYYVRVTASNEIGETIGSTEFSFTTSLSRDNWDDSNYISLNWDDVSNADFYTVYLSDTSGYEVKLDDSQISTYVDKGVAELNEFIEVPDDDTTTGPKIGPMWISGNRIWGTGDPDNVNRVYFTGTGANLGNFSPAYGGGWVDLERGGKSTATTGIDFQGQATIFCKTDDGKGTIWEISLDTITLAGTDIIVPSPTKIIHNVGTQAPRGVVHVENDVMMLNTNGVNAYGNEPGVLDVLRANDLTQKVRPYWQGLDEASLDKCCAYYAQGKVLFSVPQASGYPNRTLIYDRERMAWIKDWSIGVSQWGEFTDSTGSTKLLGIGATSLLEFSENYQGDSGSAFTWKYISPRLPMNDDWIQFAKIKRAYIKLRDTVGSISFTVLGTQKTQSFSSLATATITPEVSQSGIGWDLMGSYQIGDSEGVPTTFAQESLIRYVNINKLLRDIQFEVSGDSLQDTAILTGLKADGFAIRTASPSDWKLT